LPTRQKFFDLLRWNLTFQDGLVVVIGGIIFMFAGTNAFLCVISHQSKLFGILVSRPQVIHGALFFVANAMLALTEQERW
jgi:hypothetical protein